MTKLFPILIVHALFAGCAAVPILPLVSPFLSGQQPQVSTITSVQLATQNYKIVKTNMVGTSRGFSLLGFISLMSPDYAEATAQLYQAGESPKERPRPSSMSCSRIVPPTSFFLVFPESRFAPMSWSLQRLYPHEVLE